MEMPTVSNATECAAPGMEPQSARPGDDRHLPGAGFDPVYHLSGLPHSAVYLLTAFRLERPGPRGDFVGLANFKEILGDAVFRKAVANCFLIVALSLGIQLPVALALAIMVGRDLPGRAFFRMIFFVPYVLSEVITGIIWMSLFNPDPQRGLINALLVLIPGVKPQNFLSDTIRSCFASSSC